MRQIWKNGEILSESEGKLSIYDSALMFGDMVFEMTRSFNGKHFKLREHLERLYRSIKYVRIPLEMTIDEMEDACHEVTRANEFEPDDEHRLMINVTRGILPIYLETTKVGPYSDQGKLGPNVIISDFPLRWTTAGMGKLFDTGINCVIPSQRQIPAHLLDPKVKNRSRMHYLMANIEVAQTKGENNWPLLLDPDGFIAEGTGCNFLIVDDGIPIFIDTQHALRGISMAFISEIFENEVCSQRDMDVYDVVSGEEAFVTGTPFCMLPVTSLNGVPIGNGKVGPVFTEILGEWSSRVKVDIKAQIQAWDKGAVAGPSPYKFR